MISKNNTSVAQSSSTDAKLFKNLMIIFLLISIGSAVLFAFALSPLIAYSNAEGTIPYLSDIFYAVYWVFDLMVFFISYALTDYFIYRFKLSKAVLAILIFSLSTLAKYALNTIASFYVFSTPPTSNEDMKHQLTAVIVSALAEFIQYLIVSAIAIVIISKKKKLTDIASKNAEKIGVRYDRRTLFFPFKKLVSLKNPLQLTAFVTAIVVAFIKIVPNRLIYDILLGGFPSSIIDGIWIFIAYATDILFCILGYLLMIYVFSKADTKDLILKIGKDSK